MRLLLPLHTPPDLPGCQVPPVVEIAQIPTFSSVQGLGKRRSRLLALHNAKGSQGSKPSLHVEPPLLVVAIGELREGGG